MTETTPNEHSGTEQTLHAAVAPSFSLRALFVAGMCLVLGLWGIYDYVWAIPAQARNYQRGEISRDVHSSLDSIDAGEETKMVDETVGKLDALLAQPLPDDAPDDANAWRATLVVYRNGIKRPNEISPTDWPALREQARLESDAALELYGEATPPSDYDRPIQWLFILCLPFVPWYVWSLFSTGSRKYRLDPDGTFHMPEASWKADQIADIDMSRWMAKSICWIVNTDGTRIKLDAHIYKGLDTMIGIIAHRLHPDSWSLDARPVKAESADEASSS
ncbi:MAG: hypothetical protein CMJ29_00300 [Phycisphaerae bacterium]|nr:hypothetical protein [Phycisphaerae bacterium]|tara:strand:+ start:3223 stop:4050 length:828 start_codon:yes stop_codon:yes gene_type:complete